MNPVDLVTAATVSASETLLTEQRHFTHSDLMGRAAGVATRLREAAMGGSSGIVSLRNGPEFFAGLVGAWMAGAVPVLLDPMVKKEIFAAIDMTGARFVISDTGAAYDLPSGVVEVVPDTNGELTDPSDLPTESPVLYLFTSGSTGKPTLVPKTFAQIKVEVDFISRLFDHPKRVATLVPWCHIWGILSSFFVPLSAGGTCDLTAGVSARTVLERAAAGSLDLVVAVPAYYQAMVRLLEAGIVGDIPPGCRFASSSAPLSATLRNAFTELTGCRLTDIYGSTEAGGIAYRHQDGPWITQPHVTIRIDEESALWVRSPSVSFETEDGFYRIGDLVRPADGGFTLIGRKDDVVKVGGRRIALGEIQDTLEACPEVLRAAVFAVEKRGALRLAACVEPSGKDGLDVDAIKQFVRERLSDHKVPGIIRTVDRMPLTASGKVSREAVRAMLAEKE